MPKAASQSKPETAPLPLAPWQRQLYPRLGTALKRLPLVVLGVLALMMIWTAIPRGSSTVKVDPANIFVSDNAHLLSPSTKTAIHQLNQRYKTLPKKPQLMVITVDHLPANTSIEQFTIAQATKLGVGDAAADSGVVYLIAKAEHQARLEVGYGMEDQVPDAMTDVVTDAQVKNDYRRGDYDAGVQLVTQRLDQLIRTGDIQASRIKPVQSAAGFHPIAAIWTWLNTAHSFLTLMVAFFGVVVGLYGLRRLGWHLQARVWLDDLVQGYLAAMHSVNPDLAAAPLLTVPPAATVQSAKATLRAQLQPDQAQAVAKNTLPDYFSMQFAFGHITLAQFYANARNPGSEFKQTSMFRRHHQDWYHADTTAAKKRQLWPKAKAKPANTASADDVRPYLLTPLMQAWWWLVRLLTNGWVLILLVAGLFWYTGHTYSLWAFELHYRLLAWGKAALHFLERLLADGQSPLQVLNSLVLGLLVGGVIMAGYFALDALGTRAKRHLELNHMIRDFVGDLRVRVKQDDTDQALAAALANDDPTILQAKTALKASLAGKVKGKKAKGSLPDYYDMAFAFGKVTVAQFFEADESTKAYKSSSMYVNHASDWYASGSSDGGGGDSFGGGGFGGGGGTSSW
ncbi:MAG: TPM domain-containing protein [Lactobacillus sp.]|jgi:uncharacterized membrane protein YgcG|nr:TPM domain-containing protein [Lactobacillus sp.]MCI1917567.1 TPM domain-containing protein [Lactobacillus sp.]MCI1942296.1 TPM domain-containing protein [Lactobacillus sp.]MCI1972764.1 TPM domain-containing protein [Lactobacillus sp.]MCI2016537.1 TPM domain-containing protein [Lactobacillus sp.]